MTTLTTINSLKALKNKLNRIYNEIDQKHLITKDNDSQSDYINEDIYIVGSLLDHLELILKNLKEAKPTELLKLNCRWKRNQL